MPVPQTIALLGAPGTGAAELAETLKLRLADSALTVRAIALADAPYLPDAMHRTLHSAAITLLMGLDAPCPAPEQARREAFDARLRLLLADAAVRYQVVYGRGSRRIDNALNAIESVATKVRSTSARNQLDDKPMRLRAWDCEKCSDPDCEHRLFSALAGRDTAQRVAGLTGFRETPEAG
ncbi:hypothetical protein [Acidovorax soli]|uniref:hypothetical protein n=1 Tax=Acidovorax TaxID=12916 RepID=UPI0026EFDDA0|nr:hypothetical protein [Acidovorax soli]MCM2345495.1 hypothetical protein [Acidovorax soli]